MNLVLLVGFDRGREDISDPRKKLFGFFSFGVYVPENLSSLSPKDNDGGTFAAGFKSSFPEVNRLKSRTCSMGSLWLFLLVRYKY